MGCNEKMLYCALECKLLGCWVRVARPSNTRSWKRRISLPRCWPTFSSSRRHVKHPEKAHLEIGQIAENGRERVTVQLVPFHLPSVTSTFVPLLSPPISPSITVITSRCSTPSGTLKISWVLDNIRPPVYGDASLTVNDQPQRERARQPTHGSNAGHGGLQPRP